MVSGGYCGISGGCHFILFIRLHKNFVSKTEGMDEVRDICHR